ncbi:MAG TPA: pseudaminic acid biosynthesis-associated methylase [Gemmatimonadales bacterium]
MTWDSQEAFWAGAEGNAYHERSPGNVEANIALFARALRAAVKPIGSVLELGAGMGANMIALRRLLPTAALEALEINGAAQKRLQQLAKRQIVTRVIPHSLFEMHLNDERDLVLTKGFLIHMRPEILPAVYKQLARASRRYVLMAEYYAPTMTGIPYRGKDGLLWKGDYCTGFQLAHPEFELLDYGFVYHRDPKWPQDDLTWWLLEKRQPAPPAGKTRRRK